MKRRGDRGAAAVEYALVIALLVIGLIAGITRFEGEADERYDERGAQGDPTEEFGNLGPDGEGSSGGGGGSTDPGPGVTAITVAPVSATFAASGNSWSMTVTVSVTGDGQPLGGVTFSPPTWTPSSGGTSSCTTTSTGICTYTQSGMARTGSGAVASASFVLGTPSYTNPPPNPPPTITSGNGSITCSKPETGSASGSC